MALNPDLLEILACPQCKGELEYREGEAALLCHACNLRYRIDDGIPVMLIDEATPIEG
ncbi:MAG TPA: Trm112 family protein [Deferrisomatales bacterium]|nr:Trm112 family protein [Deferrisomatales bacterium]